MHVKRLCIGHKYSDLSAVGVMMVIQLWLTVPIVQGYVLLCQVYKPEYCTRIESDNC